MAIIGYSLAGFAMFMFWQYATVNKLVSSVFGVVLYSAVGMLSSEFRFGSFAIQLLTSISLVLLTFFAWVSLSEFLRTRKGASAHDNTVSNVRDEV
ncbi:MAG: hypothetical protein CFE44_09295 [Burkholderiales bacterium PBB4]|nr:MAG: hypothetical protein CFE44_09295 [Burkholderiales bacterium PBB4]